VDDACLVRRPECSSNLRDHLEHLEERGLLMG
jgi:hypothetical protein